MTSPAQSPAAPEETERPAESAVGPALRAGPLLGGLGLVTAATLALEVLDTRLLSVVTWYSLAFLVIAMGLFGLTAGAVHVYLTPRAFDEDRLAGSLARAARRFAIAVPVSLVLLLSVPLATAPVFTTVVLFALFSAALALPFYPAGIAIAAALTRTRLPIGRVYAVDLLGAAAGAPLVPLALRAFGGETSILVVACLAAAASLCFASAGRDLDGARRGRRLLVVLGALALANGLAKNGLKPIWVKGQLDSQDYSTELWNSHSRIRVWNPKDFPALLWGIGARCTAPIVRQHMIEIDAGAGTALYEAPHGLDALDFLTCDVTNAATVLRPKGAAAIIGVGGSRDLQAALFTGHAPVYGIEFNDRMLEILRGPIGRTSGVPENPAVHLVEDEGRSYMARTRQRFTLIQASLVDTWAATGAGAHALGENGLYTLEAFRTFFDRLEPDGVFTVSRWTQETLRVASLAMGMLLEAGVAHPRRHVALLGTSQVMSLVLSRRELDTGDVARLTRLADEKGFMAVLPDTRVDGPLGDVLAATSRGALDRATYSRDSDYRPPTDDRPYFFNVLPLEAAWSPLPPHINAGSIEGNQLATRTLVLSFLVSVGLVGVAILVPLFRRARPAGRQSRTLWAGLAYFTLIGVGFMIAEIALLQRLGLVLGHPSYSLVVVITSLVGATGLGALVSDRLPLSRAPFCFAFPLVIAAALALSSLAWPAFAVRIVPAATPVRVLAAAGLTSVLGVLLGVAFPAGIRLVHERHAEETPWFWGMNGVGSVLSSSVAIMLAERYGLTFTLLVAASSYVLLLAPVAVLATARR